MHEVGLCEGVVQTVERRAAGRPVAAIGLRIGAGHRVVPDALQQAFALVAPGTVADGARVDVVTVPFEVTCRACGAVSTATEPVPACGRCASPAVDLRGGDELTLEWLRYRDDEEH
jgi:hydrogenase nickel incorporation protein HypA/HybF